MAFFTAQWQTSEEYLYGIDLYNYAYWWECHEIFEGLWHAVGHHTEQGNFFQALIQFAAANLKRFTGHHRAAGNLVTNGIVRLQKIPTLYMGIDVARLTQDFRQHLVDSDFRTPLIRLYEREHGVGLRRAGSPQTPNARRTSGTFSPIPNVSGSFTSSGFT